MLPSSAYSRRKPERLNYTRAGNAISLYIVRRSCVYLDLVAVVAWVRPGADATEVGAQQAHYAPNDEHFGKHDSCDAVEMRRLTVTASSSAGSGYFLCCAAG